MIALAIQPFTRHVAGGQRYHHVKHDRQQQGLPGHDDVGNAEQQRRDRREGEHHDDVVDGDLNQRIVGVAAHQLTPHEHHRCTRRHPEQDHAGDVLARALRIDQAGEQVFEEEHAERRHGKRFDQPVDHQGDAQPLGLPADVLERGEVDVDHHRVNHDPDEHRDNEVDVGVFKIRDPLETGGNPRAEADPGDDAQRYPDREVAFK